MVDKRAAGFKFGVRSTKLIRRCGVIYHGMRKYKLDLVEADGKPYYALRLYNAQDKFIKQLMFEPDALAGMVDLLKWELANKERSR